MTKGRLTTIAIALWLGGFAGTAALAYSVNRPLYIATMHVAEPEVAQATLSEIVQPPTLPEQTALIVLPALEIIGTVSPPPVHPPTRPHVMRCHPWRPLEQGSNSVQICD